MSRGMFTPSRHVKLLVGYTLQALSALYPRCGEAEATEKVRVAAARMIQSGSYPDGVFEADGRSSPPAIGCFRKWYSMFSNSILLLPLLLLFSGS